MFGNNPAWMTQPGGELILPTNWMQQPFGNWFTPQTEQGLSPFTPGGASQALPMAPAAAESGGLLGWLGNYQNLGTAVQGLGTLAQAYLGYQGLKQAKEALGLQKEAFNANLNNSIQTYNTSLEDRIRGRTSDYTGKEADVAAYLAKHSLKR